MIPPKEGPRIGPKPIIIPRIPIELFLRFSETKVVISAAEVACKAAAPMPWKIRPIINKLILLIKPQNKELRPKSTNPKYEIFNFPNLSLNTPKGRIEIAKAKV